VILVFNLSLWGAALGDLCIFVGPGARLALNVIDGALAPLMACLFACSPCGGEARLAGAWGLCSFFFRKRKNQRKRASPAWLRSHAARLGLLFRVTVGDPGLLMWMVRCFY